MTAPSQQDPATPPTTIPWPPILLACTVIDAVILAYIIPLPWPGLNDTSARIVGLGFGVLGLILIIWAIGTLYLHNTTIMPHKPADQLVTTGPFSYFRNPIYLGDVFVFLGLAELTKNIWFVILAPVFMVLITWLAIRPEEEHLQAKFGDAYRDYVSKTRRWI